MSRDYIDFQHRSSPVGFLITFRCYGTWLHGDRRGSFDRHHQIYATPGLPPSSLRRKHDHDLMKQPAVKLNSHLRKIVESAIRETCAIRKWKIWTLNVRTNHIHTVVSASLKPERILSALKANATRAMKENGVWTSEFSPWSAGGSRKYLWDDEELAEAIAYVEYGQSKPLD